MQAGRVHSSGPHAPSPYPSCPSCAPAVDDPGTGRQPVSLAALARRLPRSLAWRLLLPVPLACAAATLAALLLLPGVIQADAVKRETEVARHVAQQLRHVRTLYAQAVWSRLAARGEARDPDAATPADAISIPSPAALLDTLGELMAGEGTRVRAFGPAVPGEPPDPTAFRQAARDFLRAHPDGAFVRRAVLDGRPVLRVAVADRVTEGECPGCAASDARARAGAPQGVPPPPGVLSPGVLPPGVWPQGVLEVDTDLGGLLKRERRLLLLLLGTGTGCAALLTLICVVQARRISRPIRALTATLRRLARGDTAVEVPRPRRRDEVGTMAAAVAVLKRQAEARMQARRELSLTNLRFDAALNNMTLGVCLYDADGRVAMSNQRFREMFNLSDVPVGTGMRDILAASLAAGNHPGRELDELLAERLGTLRHGEAVSEVQRLRGGRLVALSQQPIAGGGWVVTYEDVTERRRAEAQVAFMARHDALTRLPNRVLLHERLEQVLAQAGRGACAAVLCLDLDRFKPINDTLGHATGDELLRRVGTRLSACVREGDTVARLGGDEFAVVQTGISRAEDASLLAERIIAALGEPFVLGGHTVMVGTSIGVALAPADATGADRLLRCADMALYRAKLDGRGTHRFFEEEMDARLQARRALELDLRRALHEGEFMLYYQPLVDLRSNRVSAFEALLRWRHPRRGLVAPDEFIPLAEETGLIVALGAWVLERACADAVTWPDELRVAVNLSATQVSSSGLIDSVAHALDASGLPADRLELEITESVLLQNSSVTLATLHALHALGTPISMDDFGTGWSSLSYLRSFPFDKIKIDRSFISDLCDKPDAAHIVRAVTGLGNSLGMATTAEGVETDEQLSHLRREGCTEVQGYLFSPPRPKEEIPEILARTRRMLDAPHLVPALRDA